MEKDPLSKNLFDAFDNDESGGKDESSTKLERPKKEPMKVFLRIKPFTLKDKNINEDQGSVVLKENGRVELRAPRDSFQFKSSIRGLTDQTHEFSFSRVFEDTTQQKELFDETMLPFVKEILDGQNGLVFTYGVTNSGKTYTIQGTPKDGGILPRALDVIFNSVSKKLYCRANLKPKNCYDVVLLTAEEEAQENLIRKAIFNACEKENVDVSFLKTLNSTSKSDSSTSANSTFLSNISMIPASNNSDIAEEIKTRITDTTSISVEQQGNVRFGVWVSFMEIYNELIYDLLDLTPIGKGRKRISLKLGDDKNGKPYVKGLREVFVSSSNEAYKVLRLGQKNRHMASTKLNQQSSRSHCIFNIKLLKIVDVGTPHVARVSRLSIVDLAGSERYCKTGAVGDLLKQAGNINSSIMTLGKCISTLRYNQEHPNTQTIIPFRESKLTRLFQNFFLGKGKASMIVNISQCASVFDETYQVLKFSAVAKQIKMKAERATEMWRAPPLPKVPSTPSNRRPPLTIVTPATSRKRTLENPTQFSYDELVNIVGELRDKVKKERLEKANMERTLRKEVSQEMNELIVEIESSHNTELMEQKNNLEDFMEKRLDLLTKTVNKRKRKKMDTDDTTDEVSFALLEAEKKVKDRDESILTLQHKVQMLKGESDFLKNVSKSPEDNSQQIMILSQDLKEAKGTLSMQNESMERMQNMLQAKDDEIDKLMEALDDDNSNVGSNALVTELQELLEATTKELDNARVKLDNRDIRIKELENITSSQKDDNEELTKIASSQGVWLTIEKDKNSCLSLENQELLQKVSETEERLKKTEDQQSDLTLKLKETDELCKTLQFENDELSIKLEKYEDSMKEHQTILADNETFIEQLNKEVKELKEKLMRYEIKQEGDECIAKEEAKNEPAKLKDDLEKAETKVQEYSEKIERLEKQMKCFDKTPAGKIKLEAMGTPEPAGSPFKKLITPVKKINSTPTRSPYSPSVKNNQQQIIKKLEKLLEETSKALERKTSIVVQKTNRVHHLETQLSALEKKTAIKQLHSEKEELVSAVNSLKVELSEQKQKHAELQFKLENQEENSTSLESELTEITKKFDSANNELADLHNKNSFQKKKYQEDFRHNSIVLEQVEESCKKATNKNVELLEKIADSETQNTELSTNIEKFKSNENDLCCQINKLKAELETKSIKLMDVIKKLEKFESSIEVSNLEKKRANESSIKLTKQLEDRRKSRMVSDNHISSTVEGYEQRIKALHQQNDDLSEEIQLNKEMYQTLLYEAKNDASLKEESSKDIEAMKESNNELLERIKSLEDNSNMFEMETQKLKSTKLKLEMRVHAFEVEISQQSNKLVQYDKEVPELNIQVQDLSDKLNKKTKDLLEIEMLKSKADMENENNFKKILCMEKQKAETEAIISSFQENTTKNNKSQEEIKSLQKKISELQNEIKLKEKEILKHKMEYEQQEDFIRNIEEVKNQNIEMKETLHMKENELKRTQDEKKFALDELLKQTLNSKRKHILPTYTSSSSDCSTPPKDDPDFITPNKRLKKEALLLNTGGRLTRSTRKTPRVLEDEEKNEKVDSAKVNKVIIEEKIESPVPVNELTSISEDGDDYIYSVSIALSPISFEQEELKDEENDFVEIEAGNLVALKEHEEYYDIPIIGKVVHFDKEYATLEMFYGGYNKIWRVDKTAEGEPVIEKVHRGTIICSDLYFTNSKRLGSEVKRNLQKLYLSCQ